MKDQSKSDQENIKKYLEETNSWEHNKTLALENSRKLAWKIAIGACILTFMSIAALMAITPLKSVEPFIIRVDNSTGIVDVVKTLENAKTNYDEAVNKYFTQLYVRYREGYSKDLAEEYYSYVGLMSSNIEQQKYLDFFNPKNPKSPLILYGSFGKVRVRIKGTSFIKDNVALVRYTKEVERGADKPQVSHWTATITFQYLGAPMAESDRAINPLGFQVTEYRNDPDAFTLDTPVSTPVPAIE